jgi:CheY-like chemotaxis protein
MRSCCRSVLLIEDHADLRKVLAMLLTDMGFQVTAVADGLSALQHLSMAEALPCCVLTDYRLPDINGGVITETIRSNSRMATLPVVVMSADPHVALMARIAGANAFLENSSPSFLLQLREGLSQYLLQDALTHSTEQNVIITSRDVA